MADNIVAFPGKLTGRERPPEDSEPYQYRRSSGRPYRRSAQSMQTLLFRSRELILQSDEADLIRDVRFDIEKAQRKLEKIRARMESLQEYAATELQLLADADTKLSAAIAAALVSTQGRT